MRAKLFTRFICIIIILPLVSINKSSAQDDSNQPAKCNMNLPVVKFRGRADTLNSQYQAYLNFAAKTIKQNPECNIKVSGYGDQSKSGQQLSWDRVNAVIRYLVEKTGISDARIIFEYGQSGGNFNEVDLIGTLEQGSASVPAPHPNLKRIH